MSFFFFRSEPKRETKRKVEEHQRAISAKAGNAAPTVRVTFPLPKIFLIGTTAALCLTLAVLSCLLSLRFKREQCAAKAIERKKKWTVKKKKRKSVYKYKNL